jgi:hypothetical protein
MIIPIKLNLICVRILNTLLKLSIDYAPVRDRTTKQDYSYCYLHADLEAFIFLELLFLFPYLILDADTLIHVLIIYNSYLGHTVFHLIVLSDL